MTVSEVIRTQAAQLASDRSSPLQVSETIARFVRDQIPYYLDEWDLSAEDVLKRRRGMCAGKALLAAELHRAVGIPTCFKVIRILGEGGLFDFMAGQLRENPPAEHSAGEIWGVLQSIQSLPPERDHILVQVWLNDRWVDLDLSRDSDLDFGMRLVGIWRERKVLSEEGPYDSLDGWLEQRMLRRAVTSDRRTFFDVANGLMEQIREVGRIGKAAGVRVWTDDEVRKSVREWGTIPDCPTGNSDETALINRIYVSVRQNIKRGRFWELPNVLAQRQSDCLGYARLLTFLAIDSGLDAETIEVVQDNAGRYVPHYVCMVKLSDGTRQLIDPWYGSADISHSLMIARTDDGGRMLTCLMNMDALQSIPQVYGLSPGQLRGVSFYVSGNSFLARDLEAQAIDCYTASIWLYPSNPRTFFNRAIALERLHRREQAREDYRQAFAIEPSLERVQATVEPIEGLIELDEKGLSEADQQVYLLRKGFVTGKEETWSEIAARCGITPSGAQKIFHSVQKRLQTN
ncbi:MAG: transglutaminase domain-containing protein [Dehalococcoidia bacterium]|nr:transglutaminase domain-containing protein [Dehalococcoidia bacterium]